MKSFFCLLLACVLVLPAGAQITASSFTTRTVTLPGTAYTLHFGIQWTCNDFPVTSSPGRVELLDAGGGLVGWAEGHLAQSGATGTTNRGTVTVQGGAMTIMAQDLLVADGTWTGTWSLTGLSPGNYTLRFWEFENQPGYVVAATVRTHTYFGSESAAPAENPPPTTFTLTTAAGSGGAVSSGGTFPAGSLATVTAWPDADHDFAGWNGDAAGLGNPLSLLMDRAKAVQAWFALKSHALVTSASIGGTVTPGGIYPHGTLVSITATPAADARFVGWAGDAVGIAPTLSLTMTGARTVQALFAPKAAQSITFPALPEVSYPAGPVALAATASSGLPVVYAVLSGPGSVSGTELLLTGPGTVVLEASQPGNEFYLAAPAVTRVVAVTAPAVLRYQSAARTLLTGPAEPVAGTFILE